MECTNNTNKYIQIFEIQYICDLSLTINNVLMFQFNVYRFRNTGPIDFYDNLQSKILIF